MPTPTTDVLRGTYRFIGTVGVGPLPGHDDLVWITLIDPNQDYIYGFHISTNELARSFARIPHHDKETPE